METWVWIKVSTTDKNDTLRGFRIQNRMTMAIIAVDPTTVFMSSQGVGGRHCFYFSSVKIYYFVAEGNAGDPPFVNQKPDE